MKRMIRLALLALILVFAGCTTSTPEGWDKSISQPEMWSGNYAVAKYDIELGRNAYKQEYTVHLTLTKEYADMAFCLVDDKTKNQYYLDRDPLEEMGCRFDYTIQEDIITLSNPTVLYHLGNKQLEMPNSAIILLEPESDEHSFQSVLTEREHHIADYSRPTQRTTITTPTRYGCFESSTTQDDLITQAFSLSKIIKAQPGPRASYPSWSSKPKNGDLFQIIAYGGDWLSGSTTDYVVCFFDSEGYIHVRPLWCATGSLEYDAAAGTLSPGFLPEHEQTSRFDTRRLTYQFNREQFKFERANN